MDKTEYAKWLATPLTPEEEAAIIAKIKAEIDPVASEAEFRDLLKQWERGELVSMEQHLRELGIDSGLSGGDHGK